MQSFDALARPCRMNLERARFGLDAGPTPRKQPAAARRRTSAAMHALRPGAGRHLVRAAAGAPPCRARPPGADRPAPAGAGGSRKRALFDAAQPLFEDAGKPCSTAAPPPGSCVPTTGATCRPRPWTRPAATTSTSGCPGGRTSAPGASCKTRSRWNGMRTRSTKPATRAAPSRSTRSGYGAARPAATCRHPAQRIRAGCSAWAGALAASVPAATSQAHATPRVIAAAPQRGLLMLDTLTAPALAGDWSVWLEHMACAGSRLVRALAAGAAGRQTRHAEPGAGRRHAPGRSASRARCANSGSTFARQVAFHDPHHHPPLFLPRPPKCCARAACIRCWRACTRRAA